MRAQSAKRIARRNAQSAKRLEKLEKSRGGYGLGNLFGEDEPVVVVPKTKAKKGYKMKAVEDITWKSSEQVVWS